MLSKWKRLESLRITRLDCIKENYAMPDTRQGNKRKSVKGEGASQFRLARFKSGGDDKWIWHGSAI